MSKAKQAAQRVLERGPVRAADVNVLETNETGAEFSSIVTYLIEKGFHFTANMSVLCRDGRVRGFRDIGGESIHRYAKTEDDRSVQSCYLCSACQSSYVYDGRKDGKDGANGIEGVYLIADWLEAHKKTHE